jgi:hypothetical protein
LRLSLKDSDILLFGEDSRDTCTFWSLCFLTVWKHVLVVHFYDEFKNKCTFVNSVMGFIWNPQRKKYTLSHTNIANGWHNCWSFIIKGTYLSCIVWNRRGHECQQIRRHMSHVYAWTCIHPDWCGGCRGRVPHGIHSDPFFPAQAWPQSTSDFKHRRAGAETRCTPILLVWDTSIHLKISEKGITQTTC